MLSFRRWKFPEQGPCDYWITSVLQLLTFPCPMGSNLGLPRCRRILYQLSHKESPTMIQTLIKAQGKCCF